MRERVREGERERDKHRDRARDEIGREPERERGRSRLRNQQWRERHLDGDRYRQVERGSGGLNDIFLITFNWIISFQNLSLD